MTDIKIYEDNEEYETIRNLKAHQATAIMRVLRRHNIKFLLKESGE